MKLFLDTHVLIWLFLRDRSLFSESALILIDSADIYLPNISILELQFLYEIGKLLVKPEIIIEELEETINLLKVHSNMSDIIQTALSISWTRDPFDRLMVAESIFHKANLLTKDREIRRHFDNAMW